VPVPAIGVQHFQFAIDTHSFTARVDSIKPVFQACANDMKKKKNINSDKDVHFNDDGEKGRTTTEEEAAIVIDGTTVAAVWDAIVPGLRNEFDAPKSLPLIAPRPLLLLQVGDPTSSSSSFSCFRLSAKVVGLRSSIILLLWLLFLFLLCVCVEMQKPRP